MARVGCELAGRRASPWRWLGAVPGLTVLLASWAAGESRGLLLGDGRSP
jgi:hypothetical protein